MTSPCQNTGKLERVDLGKGLYTAHQTQLDYLFDRIEQLQTLPYTEANKHKIAELHAEINGTSKLNKIYAKTARNGIKRPFILGMLSYMHAYNNIHNRGES